jgi:hypothetical protein
LRDRNEIEAELFRTRRWMIDTWGALDPNQLEQPLTRSEHDPAVWWTALDHLAHVCHLMLQPVVIAERRFAGQSRPVPMSDGRDMLTVPFGLPIEQLLPRLHEMTHQVWAEYQGLPLDDVLRMGQRTLGRTLDLLGSLSAEQLSENIDGSPYGNGTVGPLLLSVSGHTHLHWRWVVEGFTAAAAERPA